VPRRPVRAGSEKTTEAPAGLRRVMPGWRGGECRVRPAELPASGPLIPPADACRYARTGGTAGTWRARSKTFIEIRFLGSERFLRSGASLIYRYQR